MNLTMNHAGMDHAAIAAEAVDRLATWGVTVTQPAGLPVALHVGTIGVRAFYAVKLDMTFPSGKVDVVWAVIEIAPDANWVRSFNDLADALAAANHRLKPL